MLKKLISQLPENALGNVKHLLFANLLVLLVNRGFCIFHGVNLTVLVSTAALAFDRLALLIDIDKHIIRLGRLCLGCSRSECFLIIVCGVTRNQLFGLSLLDWLLDPIATVFIDFGRGYSC